VLGRSVSVEGRNSTAHDASYTSDFHARPPDHTQSTLTSHAMARDEVATTDSAHRAREMGILGETDARGGVPT
jgi:hypothetical protein